MRPDRRSFFFGIASFFVFFGFWGWVQNAHSLSVNPQNVQAMAIYGEKSNYGIGLKPNQVVFNITDPTMITNLLSGVNFNEELYCEEMLARKNATVYIKFLDGTVEYYDLFGSWSHFSKETFRASCYFIYETAQTLFETHAQ